MKWCEIFKTGTHTDSKGRQLNVTEDDLDKIVFNFKEQNPDVPLVIGHPKTNAPAYGWVDQLKRDGEKLLASFKDVSSEFKEWVDKGLYKTRSISLKDNCLRHIGWLGAQPPAIKGLEAYQFEDDEQTAIFEFQNDETDDNTLQQDNDFADIIAEKDEQIKILKEQLEQEKTLKRKNEFSQFADEMIEKGHIIPAQKSFITDFMEVCNSSGEFEFSEGEDKSVLNRFKEFIQSLKQVEFSEIASPDKTEIHTDTVDFSDGVQIAKAIEFKRNEYAQKGINKTDKEILNELKKGQV